MSQKERPTAESKVDKAADKTGEKSGHGTASKAGDNHHANPPGNPVASQGIQRDNAKEQRFAAEEAHRAEQTENINRQNVPIKQPNKQTNNS